VPFVSDYDRVEVPIAIRAVQYGFEHGVASCRKVFVHYNVRVAGRVAGALSGHGV
jgi:hypothetical protein